MPAGNRTASSISQSETTPVPGQFLVSHWSVRGQSVVSALSLRGQSLASPWSVSGQSLVSPWSVTGRSVASAWSVSGQSLVSLLSDPGHSLVGPWSLRGQSLVSVRRRQARPVIACSDRAMSRQSSRSRDSRTQIRHQVAICGLLLPSLTGSRQNTVPFFTELSYKRSIVIKRVSGFGQ